jgi:hypothetical protein
MTLRKSFQVYSIVDPLSSCMLIKLEQNIRHSVIRNIAIVMLTFYRI